jgi:hypothetical protein
MRVFLTLAQSKGLLHGDRTRCPLVGGRMCPRTDVDTGENKNMYPVLIVETRFLGRPARSLSYAGSGNLACCWENQSESFSNLANLR